MKTKVIRGYEAIKLAEKYDVELHKYADPTEDARDDLSIDEARDVAREDPTLIWTVSEIMVPAKAYEDHDDCLGAAAADISEALGLESWQVEARWSDEQERNNIIVTVR